MLDEVQLEKIKATMEEEHRKDREALHRLMRFLPQNGNSAARHAELLATDSEQSDGEQAAAMTYVAAVEAILASQPERKWTVPEMIKELEANGTEMKAQRPGATIGRIFRKLEKRHKVRLVRRAAGNKPTIYKAIVHGGESQE